MPDTSINIESLPPITQPENLPSLTLAYLGDAIYELYVRSYLIKSGLRRVNDLHNAAVSLVSAEGQAALFVRIESLLDEDELAVCRRGRNAKSTRQRRDRAACHRATGLEALIGYLFLSGREDKLQAIFEVLFSSLGHVGE